jgi:hypothetical protein
MKEGKKKREERNVTERKTKGRERILKRHKGRKTKRERVRQED